MVKYGISHYRVESRSTVARILAVGLPTTLMINPALLLSILALCCGCAARPGSAYVHIDEHGGRLEGVVLGSSGSAVILSPDRHYSQIWICADPTSDSHYFLGEVTTVGRPLQMRELALRINGAERAFRGVVTAQRDRPGMNGTRYTECFSVLLTAEELDWLCTATDPTPLRLGGAVISCGWVLHAPEISALQAYSKSDISTQKR